MQSKTLLDITQSDLDKAVKKTGIDSMNMLDNKSYIVVNDSQTGKEMSTNELVASTTHCCKDFITPGRGTPVKKCWPKPPGGCPPDCYEE